MLLILWLKYRCTRMLVFEKMFVVNFVVIV